MNIGIEELHTCLMSDEWREDIKKTQGALIESFEQADPKDRMLSFFMYLSNLGAQKRLPMDELQSLQARYTTENPPTPEFLWTLNLILNTRA